MNSIYWIGPRESDIDFTGDLFAGSITLYGSNKGSNIAINSCGGCRIDHNKPSEEQNTRMLEAELRIIEADPQAKFITYNANYVSEFHPEVKNRTICQNSNRLMRSLYSKASFRSFASEFAPVLRSEYREGSSCTFDSLSKDFGPHGNGAFVVQEVFACGGSGTLLLTRENENQVRSLILPNRKYLVSHYVEHNIPVNIHAIVYSEDIVLLPSSIQIISNANHHLMYSGGDFIAYRSIIHEHRRTFEEKARDICIALQKRGYRGVLGLDALIIDDGSVLFLEMNNRFQASTQTINRALSDQGLPCIQKMQMEAFTQSRCSVDTREIRSLQVPYSSLAFSNHKEGWPFAGNIQALADEPLVSSISTDGYIEGMSAEQNAYLYRVMFNCNITSIKPDHTISLHPNLTAPDCDWRVGIDAKDDVERLKISLINQGVRISDAAIFRFKSEKSFRKGVNKSIDLYLNDMVINAPVDVKLSGLSPFMLDFTEAKGLHLTYSGNRICPVCVDKHNPLDDIVLSDGTKLGRICLFATDRVRVQHGSRCHYRTEGKPCYFCEPETQASFTVETIKEALEYYLNDNAPEFRHFLIGGASQPAPETPKAIVSLCSYIRERSNKPIYLMCVPPHNLEELDEYFHAGVTEVGFNLELFDRTLAKRYMPGKGAIPLEQYDAAFDKAVKLWGPNGAVRTAFVVGLEPRESLLKGIRHVAKRGVSPILSVFRPIYGTPLGSMMPPTNNELLDTYREAEAICVQHGLRLGPSCPACQNNVLAFDHWL